MSSFHSYIAIEPGQARDVTSIPRSGKLGAQITRLEGEGFTSLIHLRADRDSDTLSEERRIGS